MRMGAQPVGFDGHISRGVKSCVCKLMGTARRCSERPLGQAPCRYPSCLADDITSSALPGDIVRGARLED